MTRSNRAARLAGILLLALLGSASASSLIIHDGFETCWVTAKSKAQFLASIRTSIDGTSACIPPQSGNQFGISYTACGDPNGCGTGLQGCAVALQAGSFGGDFMAGSFNGPGSANNIAVPITTDSLGSCTVNITGIVLAYSLDYLMLTDGVDGVYSDDLQAPTVAITGYATNNNCNPVLGALISSFIPQAITDAEAAASAAIEPDLRADTLYQSVCPLSAP